MRFSLFTCRALATSMLLSLGLIFFASGYRAWASEPSSLGYGAFGPVMGGPACRAVDTGSGKSASTSTWASSDIGSGESASTSTWASSDIGSGKSGSTSTWASSDIGSGKSGSTSTWASSADSLRIPRPAVHCDFSKLIEAAEPNREPISQTSDLPGIFRAFLIWRQKYAHLALCTMTLCHGSCVAYGDGCLVRVQNPVLPQLMGVRLSSCSPDMRPQLPAIEGCH